jgi:hypothetical protein
MATRAFFVMVTSMLVCKSAICASDAESGRVEGILEFNEANADADTGTLESFDLLVGIVVVASWLRNGSKSTRTRLCFEDLLGCNSFRFYRKAVSITL